MKYRLLEGINSPSDVKKLNKSDIPALSREIRDFLVESTAEAGGHLASNLGVVELTLAIHTVFDSPTDHIIFDVGHQSYVHKLLTGRREAFGTLRTTGGLSGFTSVRESEHDAFGAGHSSTSISAALGMARADSLSGRECHTVCVTGDGALTGGLAHEALNNCPKKLPLVVILNENGMSISSTKGAFASYVSRVRVSPKYSSFKEKTKRFLDKLPLIGKPIRALLRIIKRIIKKIVYKPNYFEELGLYYIGPIDGHDYEALCKALTLAKSSGKTCVVHVRTVKGKGYEPAESSPDGYHSLSHSAHNTYGRVFSDGLSEMAESNKQIVGVTAAMGIGTGLESFGEKYPDRYFDVGIAEAHALTFAAGLAAGGMRPYVALYSTFLQRGYDSLLHDIALQELPVRLMIDRAGLAVSDGATHHGIFDVSFISHIPNMTLLAPASFASLGNMLKFSQSYDRPLAIRYPNAAEPAEVLAGFTPVSDDILCLISADFPLTDKPEYIFITYGTIVTRVAEAARMLRREGMSVGVLLIESLKPYGPLADKLLPMLSSARRAVFAEEGIKSGGAAELLREELITRGFDPGATEYRIAAVNDNFASPDKPCDLYDYVGLSAEALYKAMKD